MHVIVVGGGIAGLGATWELRKGGHDVTLLEKSPQVGGRCRSFRWQGGWQHTGAFAFITAESNLITLARELDLYDPGAIRDLTGQHQEHILHQRRDVMELRAFSARDILRMKGIPLREKAALARVLPKLLRQRSRNDPRDITTAAPLDTVSACAYFRRHSPTFVDYVLEPTMQMFCGWGEDDYSLAWLLWMMGGFEWAHSWWNFKGEGVGKLTRTLGERLDADGACDVQVDAAVHALRASDKGVEVDVTAGGQAQTYRGDAAIVAVPGSRVSAMLPGLDGERRAFFDQVSYNACFIVRYIIETPATPLPPTGLVLPTVDGFERCSSIAFIDLGDGRTLAVGETKGRWSLDRLPRTDEQVLDEAWQEFEDAVPECRGARILDRHAVRNEIALCHRRVGYVKALKRFRSLGPLPRVAFAGDYLVNSTVGQAHYSGLKAAEEITRVPG